MIISILSFSEHLTYFPTKSATTFLHSEFDQQTSTTKDIELNSIDFIKNSISSLSNHWLHFCNDVIQSARNDYRVNLVDSTSIIENDCISYNKGIFSFSLLFSIDKALYNQIKPTLQQINQYSDLQEGLLIMNYPTTVLATKPNIDLLYRDEILLVTQVNELGVKGVIVNPFLISFLLFMIRKNTRAYQQSIQGHSMLTLTKRKSSPSIKQYLIKQPSYTTSLSHLFEYHLFHNQSYLITPSIEDYLAKTVNTNDMKIIRFDKLVELRYPFE